MPRTPDQTQYLTFELRGEELAVPLDRVTEIIEYESVRRVPTTPPYILGVVDLRGAVVPVIDLAVKLGLGESPLTGQSCIVFVERSLEGRAAPLGLLADSVRQLITLAPAELEAPAAATSRIPLELLRGLDRSGKVLVLDLDRALADEESWHAASRQKQAGYNEAVVAEGERSPEGP